MISTIFLLNPYLHCCHEPVKYLTNSCFIFFVAGAYRVNAGEGLLADSNAPVVLLTWPTPAEPYERVLPFDSGAFMANRFDSKINRSIKIDKFLLESNTRSAQLLVDAFYGSNQNYLRGNFKPNLTFQRKDHELTGYYNLISQESEKYDDRSSSIEVQLGHSVILDRSTLAGLVMPEGYAGEPEVSNLIATSNARVQFYEFISRQE